MKVQPEKLCSACVQGKQTKASFKSQFCFSITDPFNLLHMDLFGPVPINSRSGKRYTLVIVDEFSRFTWVIFLRKKNHDADEIISFIKKNEVLYNCCICQLRSDHGTEFRNHSLENFCEDQGISQNFSVVRTRQQNGVAERRNCTVIETGRTMINVAGLPLSFWAEAVNTTC